MECRPRREVLDEHLEVLFALLIPNSEKIDICDSGHILFTENHENCFIYLIKSGCFLIRDVITGFNTKTISPPAMLGIGQCMYPGWIKGFSIEHISNGVIYKIDSQRAFEVIDSNHCWRSVVYILSYQLGFMTNRQCHLLNKSSYILIKTLLLEMSQEPEKILKNVSVEKYISERCHLGRSVIMKILSDLRKGGYIEINRGKLVKVIKLPERY